LKLETLTNRAFVLALSQPFRACPKEPIQLLTAGLRRAEGLPVAPLGATSSAQPRYSSALWRASHRDRPIAHLRAAALRAIGLGSFPFQLQLKGDYTRWALRSKLLAGPSRPTSRATHLVQVQQTNSRETFLSQLVLAVKSLQTIVPLARLFKRHTWHSSGDFLILWLVDAQKWI